MSRIVLFIGFIISCLGILSQEEHYHRDSLDFTITVTLKDSDGTLIEEGIITLISDNYKKTLNYENKGRYKLTAILASDVYYLSVKLKGHISKSIIFDFKENYEILESKYLKLDIPIDLVKKRSFKSYKTIEKEFYLGKLEITNLGSIELNSDFASSQKKIYEAFIMEKHK